MKRYFFFWFCHLAEGGEPLLVRLEDKEAYIFTKRVALANGPIDQGHGLSSRLEKIFNSITL